jgi:Tfp pilus assembly protein PilN
LDKEIELQRLKNEEQKLKNEEMKLRAEDRQSSISSKLIEAMLAKLPAAAVDDS